MVVRRQITEGGRPEAPAWVDLPYHDRLANEVEVLGVERHAESWAQVVPRGGQAGYADRTVELVAEPGGPHDLGQVAVVISGLVVGHLPPARAAAWGPWIRERSAEGTVVRAGASVLSAWPPGHPAPQVSLHVRIAPSPERMEWQERERAQAEARREAAQAARVAARRQKHAERAAWRAEGLCTECGAPVEREPGARGRRPVRCALHRHHADV